MLRRIAATAADGTAVIKYVNVPAARKARNAEEAHAIAERACRAVADLLGLRNPSITQARADEAVIADVTIPAPPALRAYLLATDEAAAAWVENARARLEDDSDAYGDEDLIGGLYTALTGRVDWVEHARARLEARDMTGTAYPAGEHAGADRYPDDDHG